MLWVGIQYNSVFALSPERRDFHNRIQAQRSLRKVAHNQKKSNFAAQILKQKQKSNEQKKLYDKKTKFYNFSIVLANVIKRGMPKVLSGRKRHGI
jgi:hypothetical protein